MHHQQCTCFRQLSRGSKPLLTWRCRYRPLIEAALLAAIPASAEIAGQMG